MRVGHRHIRSTAALRKVDRHEVPIHVHSVIDWAIHWRHMITAWAIPVIIVHRVFVSATAFSRWHSGLHRVIVVIWVSRVSAFWRALFTNPWVRDVIEILLTATIVNGHVQVY